MARNNYCATGIQHVDPNCKPKSDMQMLRDEIDSVAKQAHELFARAFSEIEALKQRYKENADHIVSLTESVICFKQDFEGHINRCAPTSTQTVSKTDMVNHPPHYTNSPAHCQCGRQIECIDVTRHMDFNLGNAVKYIWRYADKNGLEDLKKAAWYLNDVIEQNK